MLKKQIEERTCSFRTKIYSNIFATYILEKLL